MAAANVRRVMAAEIDKPENRGYADNGIAAFKEAVARFMQREFQVELDPRARSTTDRHENGAGHVARGLHQSGRRDAHDRARLPGGRHAHQVLWRRSASLPLCRRTTSCPIWIRSRPNPPPRQAAGDQLSQQPDRKGRHAGVLCPGRRFALQNEIVVVQDAAHVMLSYADRPLSFLEVPGAREVGVEVHSLSKGWNMIGWRMGWVCGHERIVRALADVKDNSDSGQFIAVQKAAAAALDDPAIPRIAREKYGRRLRKLVAALRDCGFDCRCPGEPISSTRPVPKGRAASALRRRKRPRSS